LLVADSVIDPGFTINLHSGTPSSYPIISGRGIVSPTVP